MVAANRAVASTLRNLALLGLRVAPVAELVQGSQTSLPRTRREPAAGLPTVAPVLHWLPRAIQLALQSPQGELCAHLLAPEVLSALTWHVDYPSHPTLSSRFAHALLLESEEVLVGINLTAPFTIYDRHAHAADELYLPLSTRAEWIKGDHGATPSVLSPGSVVIHQPHEPHGLTTFDEPLLNLWVQWGKLEGPTEFCGDTRGLSRL